MTAMAARTNVRTFSTGNPASFGTNDFFTPNGPGSSPATAPSAAPAPPASALDQRRASPDLPVH